MMIRITPTLAIDESEIEESFIQASGPGGQHVNKTSSAVQLRFDARRSPSLPNDVAVRLMRLAGGRLSRDGVIVISARTYRSQQRNREDALGRLIELIRQATAQKAVRRATKPTLASKRRRLEEKGRRSAVKTSRQAKADPE